MDLSKFTIKSQQALQEAQQQALAQENQSVENGHLLKGILATDKSVENQISAEMQAVP